MTTSTDIALQILTDGCQITKLRNFSTNPVIIINLNLPPTIRYNTENILLSTIIPGPNKHGNFDSWLHPLVEELLLLGSTGLQSFNSHTKKSFTLKAWPIVVSGDGPASAECMGLVNPGNAKSPCHQCMIPGVQGAGGATHYIPHTEQGFSGFEPREKLRAQIDLHDALRTDAAQRTSQKEFGITRKSVFTKLCSLHFPRSFPLDLMHCVLQNIVPSLFYLWRGKRFEADDVAELRKAAKAHKKKYPEAQPLSTDVPSYVIHPKEWIFIGDAQHKSRKTIPNLLSGNAPRRIDKHSKGYKAKEWEAWLVRDGVTLLNEIDDFEPYLKNFQQLGMLYSLARGWDITPTDLIQVHNSCVSFVREFETLYYGNDPTKLKVCRINNHALLHLCTSSPNIVFIC